MRYEFGERGVYELQEGAFGDVDQNVRRVGRGESCGAQRQITLGTQRMGFFKITFSNPACWGFHGTGIKTYSS